MGRGTCADTSVTGVGTASGPPRAREEGDRGLSGALRGARAPCSPEQSNQISYLELLAAKTVSKEGHVLWTCA
jgi:hypothetical protein